MHRKHRKLDTECYPLFYGMHYQAFLEKMNDLELPEIRLPAQLLPPPSGDVLAIGFDSAQWIRSLSASRAFAYNLALLHGLREQLPDIGIDYLIGADTPYEDRTFEIVYLSDVVRVVHPYLTRLIFKEAKRIGRRAVWVHAESDQSPYPDVDPEVSARLNDIFRLPAGNAGALFDQQYIPNPRKRFVMEKLYWTSKDEILSLAAHAELALDCMPCRVPSYPTRRWSEA